MRRRTFLGAAATALAAWVVGTAPVGVVRGRRRAPPDLLARIRRRTRPFDPAAVSRRHDLAG